MYEILATAPSTANRARRGQRSPARQRHRTCRIVIVVVNQHLPAALGRRSGGGDITAQIDQNATASGLVNPLGATIRSDRLRRRSEIEHNPGRHADNSTVQRDHRPCRRNRHRCGQQVGVIECSKVAVVSERDQGGADRGINITVGQAGRRQRGVQHLRQHLAHLSRPSRRCRERVDFGVGTEARRGSIDDVEFGVNLPAGHGQGIGIGDDDLHARTPPLPLGCRSVRDLLRSDGHEPRDLVT